MTFRLLRKQLAVAAALIAAFVLVMAYAAPARASGYVECDKYCGVRATAPAVAKERVRYRIQVHIHRKSHRIARVHHERRSFDANGNDSGLVISHKTGARAHVSARHAAKFQAYIDDLEARGATVYFMGGYRKGECSTGSQHPCGGALDVCQLERGVVAHGQVWRGNRQPNCNLPSPSQIASIASAHGLFEGGRWCNSDYGHAQALTSAGDCSEHGMYARRRIHHHRRMVRHHRRYARG